MKLNSPTHDAEVKHALPYSSTAVDSDNFLHISRSDNPFRNAYVNNPVCHSWIVIMLATLLRESQAQNELVFVQFSPFNVLYGNEQ